MVAASHVGAALSQDAHDRGVERLVRGHPSHNDAKGRCSMNTITITGVGFQTIVQQEDGESVSAALAKASIDSDDVNVTLNGAPATVNSPIQGDAEVRTWGSSASVAHDPQETWVRPLQLRPPEPPGHSQVC